MHKFILTYKRNSNYFTFTFSYPIIAQGEVHSNKALTNNYFLLHIFTFSQIFNFLLLCVRWREAGRRNHLCTLRLHHSDNPCHDVSSHSTKLQHSVHLKWQHVNSPTKSALGSWKMNRINVFIWKCKTACPCRKMKNTWANMSQ